MTRKQVSNTRRYICFLAVMMMTMGAAWAQAPHGILYGGSGTTINGAPVYTSSSVSRGDEVVTEGAGATVSVQETVVELSPNTAFTLTEPASLGCGGATVTASSPFALQIGTVVVRTAASRYEVVHINSAVTITVLSGSVEVQNGTRNEAYGSGKSVTETSSGCGALPDSAGSNSQLAAEQNRGKNRQHRISDVPKSAGHGSGVGFDRGTADWSYWTVTGTMFSSSIAGAELTIRCIDQGSCDHGLADAPHDRALLYGVGLPIEAGVSYLTYKLKRDRSRWWFVPAAIVTTGNTYMLIHSARWLSKK